MKNASAFTQRLKKLFSTLKKTGGEVTLERLDNPMEQLLISVLSNYASESRARAAVTRLHEETVDLNDLRVTPVADIVQMIGIDYPQCRPAATEISEALGALFNRTHEMSLSFLKSWPRKATDEFLDSLGTLSPHTKAGLVFRCLGGHIIPLDAAMHRYLVKARCVPEDIDVEHAQKFVSTRTKERDATAFYVLLKKYAATHAPKRLPQKKKPAPPKVAPAPVVIEAEEPKSQTGRTINDLKAATRARKKTLTTIREAQKAATQKATKQATRKNASTKKTTTKTEATTKTAVTKKPVTASKSKPASKRKVAKPAAAKKSAEKKPASSKPAKAKKKTLGKVKVRKAASKTKR